MKLRNLFHAFQSDKSNDDFLPPQNEWIEPEPIENVLLEVNPLTANMIPEPYREWVADVAERMQCPMDFIVIAAIVVTASLIGSSCGIKPKQQDDWLVIPNLWLIGRPGMLKTPAVAEVMRLLRPLETTAKQAYDTDLARYMADFEVYKADREAIKGALIKSKKQELKSKSTTDSLETNALREELVGSSEPAKPIWKRYKTNDPTIEKLSELLADNPRGLLLYRDELIGLLSSWEKEGRDSDRAFFLEAWNGDGSMTIDRISRGTIHVKNLCVSIFGNTQPAKITQYLHQAMRGHDNDGLLQRFQLLIYPDEPKEWKLIDRAPCLQARQRVMDIIYKIANMNYSEHGASVEANDRHYFQFDGVAQELFNDWLTKLEKYRAESNDHPILIEHLAKYRSLLPSLALIFHVIEMADGKRAQHISLDSVLLAINWCGYLERHARRIYGIVNSNVHHAVIKLANKIKEGEVQSPFTLRDIYRKEWSMLTDKKIVQKACDELVSSGWIRIELQAYQLGRPKSPVYVINPKLRVLSSTEENIF